jgi:S1-C subfamily serine protease
VNLLDVAVLCCAGAAVASGWRFGFVARLLAWAGVTVGLMVGIPLVPHVVTNFGGTSPNGRATAGIVFLALAAVVGEGIGLALALVLDRLRPRRRAVSTTNRAAGAAMGLLGTISVAWLVVPAATTLPGWPREVAHTSFAASALGRLAPRSGFSTSLSRSIAGAPFAPPRRASDPPAAQAPPTAGALEPTTFVRVRAAVVKVESNECGVLRTGTGWVAGRHLVVTAAHVVAGDRTPRIADATGASHRTAVVAFDPRLDVALLRASDLDAPTLARGTATRGETTLVFGHPDGGDTRVSLSRVAAVVVMTYRDDRQPDPTLRRIYVLDARLHDGDSGGPLVNTRGEVTAMVFGATNGSAYAVSVGPLGQVRYDHEAARRCD